MDRCRTPRKKLDCLIQALKIINEGLTKFSTRKEPPGADDMLPVIVYVFLMGSPPMIYSNLKYVRF